MSHEHPFLAWAYDGLTAAGERRLRPFRERLVGLAEGRVLEIGAGTGANFPYYRRADSVLALEPDPYMRRRAWRRLQGLGLQGTIRLVPGLAEELPLEDASVDHVVCTLVLCSVDDPARSLAEVRRVLRPGGSLRFLEHVRFEEGWKGWLQDRLTPLWRRLFGGCHLNRRTLDSIARAGFRLEEAHTTVKLVPFVAGVARRE